MAHVSTFSLLRTRWRNASLKTSFMVYMLGFLLLALVLSVTTAGALTTLRNTALRDAPDRSGLYIYTADKDALTPARGVDIDESGSSMFVQTVRGELSILPLADLSPNVEITDASDYQFTAAPTYSKGKDATPDFEDMATPPELTPAELPAYDAQAQRRFNVWLSLHPDSPYGPFLAGESDMNAEEGGEYNGTVGLLTSAVGYYVYTPPSDDALALSTVLGVIAFLMFPLWFGVCIFAAARRFFRQRLEPGFAVLNRATASIAEQDLEFSVAYDRDDELGKLAASFETMRSSLAQSQRAIWRTDEERKRLNAAFAHDLRTPLTILKGKIELLAANVQAGDVTAERLAVPVASLAAQVDRLERYVMAMSGLQKLEDRVAVVRTVDFNSVADMIEDTGCGLAACGKCMFTMSVSSRCNLERPVLRVDMPLVGEVAENLLNNAMRYATSRVDAYLDVQDDAFVLTVDDDGPGFTAAALEQGCAPFFSEAPSAEHFGLGLNIASLMCQTHGGELLLQNQKEGGARVIARFSMTVHGGEGRHNM